MEHEIASPPCAAKTNMGQLVNNNVKAGHSKQAWADYDPPADAQDSVGFFLAHGVRHTCCQSHTEPERPNHHLIRHYGLI